VLCQLVELGYLEATPGDAVEPTYRFRQPFVREVIEASLPELQRRRLHERAAVGLQLANPDGQDPAFLERVAHHFSRAGRSSRAVEYLMRRADFAGDAAIGQYRLALQEAEHLPETADRTRLLIDLQERLGDLLLRQADLAEAQIAFESACDLSSSEQRRAALRFKLGVVANRRGNHRRVLELAAATAADSDPSVEPAALARAMALAAISLAAQGDVQQAGQRAAQAVELAAQTDPGTRGQARYALGCVQYLAGQLAESQQSLGESSIERDEAADPAGWLESQIAFGLVTGALGELLPALEVVRSALARCGPTGDPWNLARGAAAVGELLVNRGQTTRGAGHLSRALRVAERIGARELALEARVELARANVTGDATVDPQVLNELRSLIRSAAALELDPLVCRARLVLSNGLSRSLPKDTTDPVARREAIAPAEEALGLARRRGLGLYEGLARRALEVGLPETHQ
jgi:tetratricopeptide (TPR) repeat protein